MTRPVSRASGEALLFLAMVCLVLAWGIAILPRPPVQQLEQAYERAEPEEKYP